MHRNQSRSPRNGDSERVTLKVQESALISDAGWCADQMNGVMVSSLLRSLLSVFNVAITLSEKQMD